MKRNQPTRRPETTACPRREFLTLASGTAAGTAAAVGGLATLAVPHVHAAEDNTIRLALIGCGGRGSGAVANAFSAPGGPVKLTAMADLFEGRLASSHANLSREFPNQVDVPKDRRFIGFDAYRHAIDCLKPGDVAVLGTYPAFRVVHLDYAVSKGVNVFMEKSFATDPPGVRRVIKAGEEAKKKNLKIAAGLMCRHSRNRQELIRRIRDGELGQIQLIRAYRMEPVGPLAPRPPEEKNELLWQIKNSIRFLWVCGGLWAEMDIHQIDEICWIKDAYPISAHGVGGRAADSADCGQNLDSFSVEYTFADGTIATDVVRYLPECYNHFATYLHGTKKAAQFSGAIHAPTVHIYKDQRCLPNNIEWRMPNEPYTSWQAEWNVLINAIRKDLPHNEAKRAALSNLADIMGRAAIHSGKVITWDEAMASNFQWVPNIDAMNENTPSPIKADAQGRYPVPVPGRWTEI